MVCQPILQELHDFHGLSEAHPLFHLLLDRQNLFRQVLVLLHVRSGRRIAGLGEELLFIFEVGTV